MTSKITDVIIHTKEALTSHQFNEVSKTIHQHDGIVSFGRNERTPHLLMVVYNASKTKAKNILNTITRDGITAQLVGI